jgi:hypothetical protein
MTHTPCLRPMLDGGLGWNDGVRERPGVRRQRTG